MGRRERNNPLHTAYGCVCAARVQVSGRETDSWADSCNDTASCTENLGDPVTSSQISPLPGLFYTSSSAPCPGSHRGSWHLCSVGSCRCSWSQRPRLTTPPPGPCPVFMSPPWPTNLVCPASTMRTSTMAAETPVTGRALALPPKTPQLCCPHLPEAHWLPPHPHSHLSS